MKTKKQLIVYFELETDYTKRVPMSSINWSYSPGFLNHPAMMRAEDYDQLPFKRAAVSADFFREFPEGTLFVTEIKELAYLLRGFGVKVSNFNYDLEAGAHARGLASFTAREVCNG